MKYSSKDKNLDKQTLSFIQNQLNYENLLYKKYLAYSDMCLDNELKTICYKASKRHKENYNNLISYLENC